MKLRTALKSQTSIALALASCLSVEAGTPPHPKLRILWDKPLPSALAKSVDIRWASDHSVYLAMLKEGTVEVSLSPPGADVKEIVPGNLKPGGFWGSSRLGASTEFFVVAGPAFSLTWAPRAAGAVRKEEGGFDFIEDIDVGGDRLLILGASRDEKRNFAPEGAVAWLGSLDKGLQDWRPVVFDALGPGAPSLANCGNFALGAVRFLADGSFVVFPGFQPGLHLFDRAGKLLRTWDTMAWGFAADCSKLNREEARRIHPPRPRIAWLNQLQTLDDILPLSEGPGLIVRRVVQGRVLWHLKVIPLQGEARTYEIPIEPQNPQAHLHGDVRAGTIVFLVHALGDDFMSVRVPRVAVAEVPADM